MKNTIILSILTIIACFNLAGAQQSWITVENVIPDTASAALKYATVNSADTNSAVYQGLKNLEKNGSWRVRYSNQNSGAATLHPNLPGTSTEDTGKMLAFAGRDGGGVFTQHATSFSVSEDILQGAQGVRISFNVDYMGKNGDTGLDISVLPWVVREQEIELRTGTPNATYRTKFLFALVNLETGEFYDASLSSEDAPHVFGYESNLNNWFYHADEFGSLTVSFELTAEQVETITASGLGLLVETTPGSGTYAEYYSIGDFKFEVLKAIPEPAELGVMVGVLVLAFVFYRRHRRDF